VKGRVRSFEAEALNRQIDNVSVDLLHGQQTRLMYHSKSPEFEFLVPPGRYRLLARATYFDDAEQILEVPPDRPELNITVDVSPEPLAYRFGHPAPELQKIRSWRGGPPVTLAELKGKVVLLVFLGDLRWAVREVPTLISLYDEYHETGLAMVGVLYDRPRGRDVAELLAEMRDTRWRGRNFPFPIAIEATTAAGTDDAAVTGATSAECGVTNFPTTLLIARDGVVVREFHNNQECRDELRRILNIPPGDLSSYRPSWRRRIDEVYRLSRGETIKRIPTPFIPERRQFVTSELRVEPLGTIPQRLRILDKVDGQIQVDNGESTLGALINSLEPWDNAGEQIDCPQDLAQLQVDGDWVVRHPTSYADRLTALERILVSEVKLPIRIEPVPVAREAIVVTGRYRFGSLYPDQAANMISVTADPTDASSQAGGGARSKFAIFLSALSGLFRRPIIDDTEGTTDLELEWRQRESAVDNFRVEDPRSLNPILANLALQTGLSFTRETRPVTTWQVRRTTDEAMEK
jgi:hypothetical protein